MKTSSLTPFLKGIFTCALLFSAVGYAKNLEQVLDGLEQSGQAKVAAYKQLEHSKQIGLQEVQKIIQQREDQLEKLNEKNRDLEDQLLQLQQKFLEKQQQVERSKDEIKAVIELTSAQQELFVANGRQLSTWNLITIPSAIDKEAFEIATVRQLWLNMAEQLVKAGQVLTAPGEIVLPDGRIETKDIIHVGPFSQYSPDYGWLVFQPSRQSWTPLAPQPDLAPSESSWILDPTFGAGFEQFAHHRNWFEQYRPAGLIGLLIALVAIIGLSVGTVRLCQLAKEKRMVDRQTVQLDALSDLNILGRVLIDLTSSQHAKQIEDVVDASVSRELPWLNKGVGTLAVLAAIAPLMGLLGTVGGMIETFSVITAQGVTDSDLLSGGIAEALLTTKLGLMVAIPLLIFHCLIKSKAQALAEIIEQQVSGLVVQMRYGKAAEC
ncbi:MotA/TolQ/ExbB proton channel family protein [Vibrio nereis]|uniref:MotA/TolQ/ExbB proton channel family protein n=1 Tax=Vibrio nereis TaxID=693 RepID=UPI0006A98722|nr:MotA/TolQ/ExbB proton channel family protein [Vibrio nereis]